MKVAVGGEEGVLSGILGVGVITQDAIGEIIHEVTVLFDDGFKVLLDRGFHHWYLTPNAAILARVVHLI